MARVQKPGHPGTRRAAVSVVVPVDNLCHGGRISESATRVNASFSENSPEADEDAIGIAVSGGDEHGAHQPAESGSGDFESRDRPKVGRPGLKGGSSIHNSAALSIAMAFPSPIVEPPPTAMQQSAPRSRATRLAARAVFRQPGQRSHPENYTGGGMIVGELEHRLTVVSLPCTRSLGKLPGL